MVFYKKIHELITVYQIFQKSQGGFYELLRQKENSRRYRLVCA